MQTTDILILHLRKLRPGEIPEKETCGKDSSSKLEELRVSQFPFLQNRISAVFSAPTTPAGLPGPTPPVVYWQLSTRDQRISQPMGVAHGETFPGKPRATREPGSARSAPMRETNPR